MRVRGGGGKKKNQQITFQQVFQNKNNNEGRIILHFNPGGTGLAKTKARPWERTGGARRFLPRAAPAAGHKRRTMGVCARARRVHKSGRVNGEAGFEIYIKTAKNAFKD